MIKLDTKFRSIFVYQNSWFHFRCCILGIFLKKKIWSIFLKLHRNTQHFLNCAFSQPVTKRFCSWCTLKLILDLNYPNIERKINKTYLYSLMLLALREHTTANTKSDTMSVFSFINSSIYLLNTQAHFSNLSKYPKWSDHYIYLHFS